MPSQPRRVPGPPKSADRSGSTASRAAKDALRRGAWVEARTHLETSIAAGETAEALEDLGLVGWWLDDATLTFSARERAYSLYRDVATRAAPRA